MKEYFQNQKKLEEFVYSKLKNERTGHDSSHIKRVLLLSLNIAKKEKRINYKVLVASCLLHDISLSNGKQKNHHLESANLSKIILKKYDFNEDEIRKVYENILNHDRGFSNQKSNPLSKEAKILCDADRLDALGAIGIIRMVQFSVQQNVPLIKNINDKLDQSIYGNIKYLEKLGKDLLTKQGKKIARKKEKILRKFILNLEKETFF